MNSSNIGKGELALAKCKNCGKSGFYMEVSSTGLCIACLERAVDSAIKTLEALHSSKSEREKFCKELDKTEEEEAIEKAIRAFGGWDISAHKADGQFARMIRSNSVKFKNIDKKKMEAEAIGSSGAYAVTVDSCTCGDFVKRHLPCKHMYRLAEECGKANFKGIK